MADKIIRSCDMCGFVEDKNKNIHSMETAYIPRSSWIDKWTGPGYGELCLPKRVTLDMCSTCLRRHRELTPVIQTKKGFEREYHFRGTGNIIQVDEVINLLDEWLSKKNICQASYNAMLSRLKTVYTDKEAQTSDTN